MHPALRAGLWAYRLHNAVKLANEAYTPTLKPSTSQGHTMHLQDDGHALARVLLNTLTEHQLDTVLDYINTKGSAVRHEMAQFRRKDGIPPLLSFLDPVAAGTDPETVYHILVAMTIVNAANLANDADAQDYAEILVEGAGFTADTAEEIASQIVSERSVMSRFGSWVAEKVANLQGPLTDSGVAKTLFDTVTGALSEKVQQRLEDPARSGLNNIVEWNKLGREIISRSRDAFLVGAAAMYEQQVHRGPVEQYERTMAASAESGNPMEPVNIGGFDSLEEILTTLMGVPSVIDETGNPIPVSAEERNAAREALAHVLQLDKQAQWSPYHSYSVQNPEVGGLFSALGRIVKKAAKAVSSITRPFSKIAGGIVQTALPLAGKAVGTMFGGPAGGMIGGQAGSFLAKATGQLTSETVADPIGSLTKNPWRAAVGIGPEALMRSLGGGGRHLSPTRPRTQLARVSRPSDAQLMSTILNMLRRFM